MESNIKNNDKELFFESLNDFLKEENGIKGTKIFTELRKIPQVLNKNIPWINSGINAYNDSLISILQNYILCKTRIAELF